MVFRKRGAPGRVDARPVRAVLDDKAGAGVADGLGGMSLLIILSSMVALGVTGHMQAVQTVSVKADRQALVSSLVDDRRQGAAWGSPDAPTTETMPLENGGSAEVTLWREVTPEGTSLTAVTATTAGEDAADCSVPSDIERGGCIYASRFHAGDLDSIDPQLSIRKTPATAGEKVVGTVDARVGTTGVIPQGTVFATGIDAEATTWRYLITAAAAESTGEVRISQAGKTLAVIPVGPSTRNYFGTFSAETNVPVTATVTEGNVTVQTVMTYRAGGTQ